MTSPAQTDLLDEIARARTTDPETSHAAARSVKVRDSQKKVLELLRRVGPCTDDDLAIAASAAGLHISPSGLRSRRSELVDKDLAHDTGNRATLRSGRQAIVWDATR